jgi:hypothetical protein
MKLPCPWKRGINGGAGWDIRGSMPGAPGAPGGGMPNGGGMPGRPGHVSILILCNALDRVAIPGNPPKGGGKAPGGIMLGACWPSAA